MRKKTITDEAALWSLIEAGVEIYHRYIGDAAERRRPCNNEGMLEQRYNTGWRYRVRESLREQAYYVYVE